MKNYITILKFIISQLIISIPSLFAQWDYQESGVNVTLNDICFVDSLYGWSIGDSSTIISTISGGESWNKQLNPDTIRTLNKIQFINKNVGYIIGDNGLILKSINGGLNWQKIDSMYTYNYSDISFIDINTGWLSGWEETPQTRTGVILHTSDGGKHWDKQMEIISPFLFGSTIFMSIAFLNDSVGWALGGDYADNFSATYTYFTSDAGVHWDIIGQWESAPLFKLTITNGDTLWAGGFIFVVSFDGGRTWIITDDEDQIISPIDLSPVSGLKGWAVNYNFISGENEIMYTANGGNSWQIELDLSATPAWAMTNVAGKYLWVVGEHGLIMKKNVNFLSIKPIEYNIIQNFRLEQNYPNPFNQSTIIRYEIIKRSRVELNIYNVLGEKIENLLNEYKNPGTYKITFDGKDLPTGIYYCVLSSQGDIETIKMIYLR